MSCKSLFPVIIYISTSQNKNALKRISMFLKIYRELLAGGKQQWQETELVSKQLAEIQSRWSRGLAVNKQEGIDSTIVSVPIECIH